MRIGELSKKSGFPIKTLRYYDEIGLIRPSGRDPVSRFREYGEEALDMLALVGAAKLAGLSLTQIKQILVAARRGSACDKVIPLLDEKVEEIDRAMRALQELRARLVRAVKSGKPKSSRKYTCAILEGLSEKAHS